MESCQCLQLEEQKSKKSGKVIFRDHIQIHVLCYHFLGYLLPISKFQAAKPLLLIKEVSYHLAIIYVYNMYYMFFIHIYVYISILIL